MPVREDGTPLATAGMIVECLFPSGKGFSELREFVKKVDSIDSGVKVPGFKINEILHKTNLTSGKSSQFDERFNLVVDILIPIVSRKDIEKNIMENPQIQAWAAEYVAAQKASEEKVREVLRDCDKIAIFEKFEPAMVDVVHEAKPETLFAVFPSPGDEWMVQQIPVEKHSFTGRLSLPESWAGLRGVELDLASSIEDCVFVHPGGFIGGHKTQEGAVKMARKAIELANL
jgi:uncharacterized UPF0160 family protein